MNLQKNDQNICYIEGWLTVAVLFYFCSYFILLYLIFFLFFGGGGGGVTSPYLAFWDRNDTVNNTWASMSL